MSKLKIWSCKLKRPDTLKSHRTLETATKRAGDHGFVYCPDTDRVYQVHKMVGGGLARFDTATQADMCNTGGFDMRKALAQFDIPTSAKVVE